MTRPTDAQMAALFTVAALFTGRLDDGSIILPPAQQAELAALLRELAEYPEQEAQNMRSPCGDHDADESDLRYAAGHQSLCDRARAAADQLRPEES